jgi:hypothetical protein
MARKKPETFAVLAVHARTGNGDEVCRVGNRDVALKIAARLRYEETTGEDSPHGKRILIRKYERVTTMEVYRDGSMERVRVG